MVFNRDFYKRDTIEVSKALLGKKLVHIVDGVRLGGIIVEVEAYGGKTDKAAHSYGGRRTPRVEVMYGEGGRAYVYFIYGLYYCMNVVTQEENIPEAVLIRALEPVEGLDHMSMNRFGMPYEELTKIQKKNLTNGPSKLCSAMEIDRKLNGHDLCLKDENDFFIEDAGIDYERMVSAKRIGIDYAEEAKDYPWRFYIENNPYVSKK